MNVLHLQCTNMIFDDFNGYFRTFLIEARTLLKTFECLSKNKCKCIKMNLVPGMIKITTVNFTSISVHDNSNLNNDFTRSCKISCKRSLGLKNHQKHGCYDPFYKTRNEHKNFKYEQHTFR